MTRQFSALSDTDTSVIKFRWFHTKDKQAEGSPGPSEGELLSFLKLYGFSLCWFWKRPGPPGQLPTAAPLPGCLHLGQHRRTILTCLSVPLPRLCRGESFQPNSQ